MSGSLLLLWACKKELSREGEVPPVVSTCSYAPYTAGSVFNYDHINSSNPLDTGFFTVTVTGDSTINGQTFRKLTSDTATTYDRCDGNGNYYQLVKGLSFEGYTADSIVSVYLKDNVNTGASWTDTVTVRKGSDAQTVILTYTVTQKGVQKSIYGLDFTNVIGVALSASVKFLGTTISLGTVATNYYAEGVGLIEIDQAEDTTRLRQYSINQ
ncbi:MAG TPA: hypothetical protein VFS25_07080 [Chitinophaga sp.]|uniref:hypothetical protein n=1 Tax=Chitinophaga sp. TaxID=1869181 RepID=UPI002DBC192B|nr:hypothetical protein [Chitinophaga sp.]HEU4552577.1 hypothetical protein [Chitinophaga sp.]